MIEDYGTGIMVAWHPLPPGVPLDEMVNMSWPNAPQRDEFGNDELDLLEVVE